MNGIVDEMNGVNGIKLRHEFSGWDGMGSRSRIASKIKKRPRTLSSFGTPEQPSPELLVDNTTCTRIVCELHFRAMRWHERATRPTDEYQDAFAEVLDGIRCHAARRSDLWD